jgi:hypothetical protein
MDDEEKLLYGLFLNYGVRDAEMQNTEYADFNWEKCTLHVQPKAWRKFRLADFFLLKDRFIPIPAKAGLENQRENETAQRSAA